MTITEIPTDAFLGEIEYDGGEVTPWAPFNVGDLTAGEGYAGAVTPWGACNIVALMADEAR